jgi:hypothetical protein
MAGVTLFVMTLACASEDPNDDGANSTRQGIPLELELRPASRTFVELATPSVIDVDGDGSESFEWDLAFAGLNVFTNSGVSGPGDGAGFGPLTPPTFLSDTAPDVPFWIEDRAGGAFLDWYEYEAQALYSRYHVYGLRDGERLYKVQILSYYGEVAGAPVSALYRLRYAEVLETGASATMELTKVDATAGGVAEPADEPSACLELETGSVLELLPEQAVASEDWHLCLRRDVITANGGLAGPRGVEAVDLEAAETAGETPEEIKGRTAASELAAFDAVDFATLDDDSLVWVTDGVVSAFGRRWLEPESDPKVPAPDAWAVRGADGTSKYLLRFDALSGDPEREPATLKLEVKSVR